MLLIFFAFIWTWLFQVLSIACCVFYSHCGNQVPQHKPTLWSPLSQESIKWVAGALEPSPSEGWNMQQMKSQVCWKWLAPVGSAKDYPVFSKWVVYGEVNNILITNVYIIYNNREVKASNVAFKLEMLLHEIKNIIKSDTIGCFLV